MNEFKIEPHQPIPYILLFNRHSTIPLNIFLLFYHFFSSHPTVSPRSPFSFFLSLLPAFLCFCFTIHSLENLFLFLLDSVSLPLNWWLWLLPQQGLGFFRRVVTVKLLALILSRWVWDVGTERICGDGRRSKVQCAVRVGKEN